MSATDPNMLARLRENQKERRSARAGESMERAVTRYDAVMRGIAPTLISSDTSQRMGVAGLSSGLAQNAQNAYTQFQPRPHWGLSLLNGAVAGGSQIASSAYTGGR